LQDFASGFLHLLFLKIPGAFFAQRDFAPQNPQGKKPGFAGLRSVGHASRPLQSLAPHGPARLRRPARAKRAGRISPEKHKQVYEKEKKEKSRFPLFHDFSCLSRELLS
jgi:hypothetical protein